MMDGGGGSDDEREINRLIKSIDDNGRMTIDLVQILRIALQQHLDQMEGGGRRQQQMDISMSDDENIQQQQQQDFDLLSVSEEDAAEDDSSEEEEWDEREITAARWQQILRDPAQYVEFIYRNRRFKLKPIGTIEPVAKRIHEGRNGALYYYKTRGPNEERLTRDKWTKIYLKPYQVRQCRDGRSIRGTGLAGNIVGIGGPCANQPAVPRIRAQREPKQVAQQRNG